MIPDIGMDRGRQKGRDIVLLLFQPSIIARGMEKKLIDLKYRVRTIVGNFDEMNRMIDSANLFILNLPTDVLGDHEKLKKISNVLANVAKNNKKLIIVGERSLQEDLEKEVPAVFKYQWLFRPVDMETLDDDIQKAMNTEEGQSYKKRVLIIDDDPSYAKMVREWISEDYRVDIVTAGMQAIAFLLKVPEDDMINLILLDYDMPVVDGPQVLQMLRQDSHTAHIPVVFLTGVGSKEEVQRVMELKPDGYILKSTTKKDLIDGIRAKI